MARILIVDDEESDRLLPQSILEHAGHETVQAKDGEEGLRLYLNGLIDVVVTDLQMPRLNGLELIASLRQTTAPPTIIALSGAGYAALRTAHVAGADATLTKPVDPEELLAAIAMAVTDEE